MRQARRACRDVTEITPEIDDDKAADTGGGEKRSRVTTGRTLLHGIDGRTREARRYRDVLDGLVVQFDIIDESDLALARRYASMSVLSEVQEAKQARGESADTERMIRAANTQRRIRNALEASYKARQRSARRMTP